MKQFKDLGIPKANLPAGEKIKIDKVLNREIVVTGFRVNDSKYQKNKSGKCLTLEIEIDGAKRILFTDSDVLLGQICAVACEDFPFATSIVKTQEHFEFT